MTRWPVESDRATGRGHRRWLPTPLLIIVSVVLGSVINVVLAGATPTGTYPRVLGPLHEYPWPAAVVVTVIAALLSWWRWYRDRPSGPGGIVSVILDPDRVQARGDLLAGVRQVWLEEFLGRWPDVIGHIELGLVEAHDSVSHPWWETVPAPVNQTLPFGEQMSAVVRRFGGHLLILGAPGAGKTRLLLEYARHLLDEAERNPSSRIPVVFHLSSWRAGRSSLAAWLVDELSMRYGLQPLTAGELVQNDKLAVLLDGLDETPAAARASCLAAINGYLREPRRGPVVVCARIDDYTAGAEKLQLNGAIQVGALSNRQVTDCLSSAGPKLAGLRDALTDPGHWLWEHLNNPLLLSVASLTYADKPVGEVDAKGSVDRLFETYVNTMLGRPQAVVPGQSRATYSRSDTLRWLSSLARLAGPVIYPDSIQPEWLESRRQRWLSTTGLGIAVGLAAAVVAGVPVWMVAGPVVGLVVGVMGGLIAGVVAALPTRRTAVTTAGSDARKASAGGPRPVERVRWDWDRARRRGWWVGLRAGAVSGLCICVATSAHGTFVAGLIAGAGGGLVIGLADAFAGRVAGGLIGAPVAGLLVGLFDAPLFGLAGGLAIGLVEFSSGLTSEVTAKPARPYEAIQMAARVARGAAFLGAPVGGLVGMLAGGVPGGLFGAIVTALAAWLRYGGAGYLRYRLVSYQLVRAGLIPADLGGFLDYADSRLLLRRRGGGYQFFHDSVRTHFAERPPERQDDVDVTARRTPRRGAKASSADTPASGVLPSWSVRWPLLAPTYAAMSVRTRGPAGRMRIAVGLGAD